MNGHWFCSGRCNDVVNKPKPYGRWDVLHGVTCPVCHQDTADWVPDNPRELHADVMAAEDMTPPPLCFNPVSQARGAELFAKMKGVIE